jgi:hypothetical protein
MDTAAYESAKHDYGSRISAAWREYQSAIAQGGSEAEIENLYREYRRLMRESDSYFAGDLIIR